MFIIYAETDYFLCDVRAGAEEIFEQIQYKTAQSDGSTSTDKIKLWFTLNAKKGQTTEAVKQSVIGPCVDCLTINYIKYRKAAL